MSLTVKNRVVSILVALLFLPVSSRGQEKQRGAMPERNSIDWFDFAANYHEKPLLLKILLTIHRPLSRLLPANFTRHRGKYV